MTTTQYPAYYAVKTQALLDRCAGLLERGAPIGELHEAMDCSHAEMWRLLTYCIEKHGITRHGGGKVVRYFSTSAAGEAWNAERIRSVAARQKERDRIKSRTRSAAYLATKGCMPPSSPRPRPQDTALQRFKESEGKNPNNVKTQILASGKDFRFSAPAGHRGEFQASGIARYPVEPRPWTSYLGASNG